MISVCQKYPNFPYSYYMYKQNEEKDNKSGIIIIIIHEWEA